MIRSLPLMLMINFQPAIGSLEADLSKNILWFEDCHHKASHSVSWWTWSIVAPFVLKSTGFSVD